MKLFFLLSLALTSISFAAPVGKVLKLKGSAAYLGKAIKEGESLSGTGEISVADKSYLKLSFEDAGHIIVLTGNSKLEVDFSMKTGEERVRLSEGLIRWVSGKIVKKEKAGVTTKLGAMGVRGTDFLVSAHPIWVETETICFEGEISFTNSTNRADREIVKAGQWGGIGGRFGKRLAPVMDLDGKILKTFDGLIPLN